MGHTPAIKHLFLFAAQRSAVNDKITKGATLTLSRVCRGGERRRQRKASN